jgi:MoxR-like ATPase
VVDDVLMALFCNAHILLVGVPGLAKTLLISTLGKALQLDFKRVQFTPDLLPGDITGSIVVDEVPSTRCSSTAQRSTWARN